jgi:hypothetical protein
MMIYTLIEVVGICMLMGMIWLMLDVAWDALTDDDREDNL